MSDANNAIPIEAWNTVLFDKFVRFQDVIIKGLSQHSNEFLRRAPYPKGARVLDIGCGFGDSTIVIAREVGNHGEAIGVDCATKFIELATNGAKAAKVANAAFFAADVQADDLRGPYDAVFSRFGTMFFNLPGLALRNIRKALKPGGPFGMIVWRKREENPWVHEAELLVKEMMPVVSHEDTDQVHCGPGPFSMAGADMVSSMLIGAGFERIAFERYDTDICIGRTLDEAVDFAMALGPAGEIIRLAGDQGAKRKHEVSAALRKMLATHLRGPEVWAASSAWFVTARNPN